MLFRKQTRQQYGTRPNNFHQSNNLGAIPGHLDLLCKNRAHPLPCRMRFIGAGTSPKGQGYATYACPLCNTREGWVNHHHTGKPFRLWSKPAM